ncbi:RNase H domain-containing protein [Trichonephila clavipes]|nr:RNase H domain-containing protein [Trichonephila clavipes]
MFKSSLSTSELDKTGDEEVPVLNKWLLLEVVPAWNDLLLLDEESWSQQLDNKLYSVKPVVGAWPVMPMRRTDVKLTRLRIGHGLRQFWLLRHKTPHSLAHSLCALVAQFTNFPSLHFRGVIFDSKLTFLPHVLYLRKKCERSLKILKVLTNTLWGADRISLLRVYQALILSRLDYGCVVYGSARASVLKRLDTIHHSALRIFSGAFRTSPVTSLYVVCHPPPLELRRRQLSANYFIRAMSIPSHPLKPFALAIGLNRL